MIKRFIGHILIIILILGSSCEKLWMQADPENTPVNNFQVLWDNLDRKYSFFTYKNVDWDSIYRIYQPIAHDDLHDTSLFRILGEMTLELKDAHTDIWSPYGKTHYDYTENIPSNFSEHLLFNEYLGIDAGLQEGIHYRAIDSIGYLYIESFSNEITNEGFREIINDLGEVKGYILDVRDNEGGNSNNGLILANHFFDSTRLAEITYLKTGPGHDDFYPVKNYITPKNSLGIDKPTVILTNRKCYSATNFFVCWMSVLPHVSLLGDTTGGGGGTPHFSELPNGWGYRYSATQSYRPDGLNIDLGIPPDRLVYQSSRDTRSLDDSLIEYALRFIEYRTK